MGLTSDDSCRIREKLFDHLSLPYKWSAHLTTDDGVATCFDSTHVLKGNKGRDFHIILTLCACLLHAEVMLEA